MWRGVRELLRMAPRCLGTWVDADYRRRVASAIPMGPSAGQGSPQPWWLRQDAHEKWPGHCVALERFGSALDSLLMDTIGWEGRRSEAWPGDTSGNGGGVLISPQIFFIFFRCLQF